MSLPGTVTLKEENAAASSGPGFRLYTPSRDNEFYRDAFIKARLRLGSSHAAHDKVTV